MSANVAVIYGGVELRTVAEALGEAAVEQSASVRLRRVPGEDPATADSDHLDATGDDLGWADGIAFGTPVGPGRPSPALMHFIAGTERLWSNAKPFDKVVSIFTDEPDRFAPDPVVRPIFDALYRWGAVIVGPRMVDLAFDAQHRSEDLKAGAGAAGPSFRTAQYRGRRLAAIAGVLSAERARRSRLEL